MIEMELPWPPAILSANGSHGHWAPKAAAKKRYRNTCAMLARSAFNVASAGVFPEALKIPTDGPITVSFDFLPPDRRSRDWDGLLARMKAACDGIADALEVNDSRFRPALNVGEVQKGGAVKVRLTWACP